MKFKYQNKCTGELYRNLFHAITTIIWDMIHYPKCRTLEMFKLEKGDF